MSYDVAAIRQKLRKQMSGKFSDPDEFRPPKAEDGKELNYRFFVLPPIAAGDELKSGKADRSMEMFYVQHANHWIQDKPYPCPRVWSETDCPICTQGFDFLKQDAIKKDEVRRKQVISEWMPNSYYMVNIFFTSWKGNPEDLRGRVKFYNAPKTCFDIWTEALMREEPGDPEDPKAFGVFFDENAGFQFQLTVTKQGRNNSYRTSKFLANAGKPQPMAKTEDGIAKLLKFRHNLFTKIEEPNMEKLNKLYSVIMHGDDDNDSGGGFDEDETKTTTEDKIVDDSPVDEDVVDDGPVDDGPTEDGPVDDGSAKADKPVAEASSSPADEPESDSGDEDDEELDALLDQLGDDD
jgi:hypothetical protein